MSVCIVHILQQLQKLFVQIHFCTIIDWSWPENNLLRSGVLWSVGHPSVRGQVKQLCLSSWSDPARFGPLWCPFLANKLMDQCSLKGKYIYTYLYILYIVYDVWRVTSVCMSHTKINMKPTVDGSQPEYWIVWQTTDKQISFVPWHLQTHSGRLIKLY